MTDTKHIWERASCIIIIAFHINAPEFQQSTPQPPYNTLLISKTKSMEHQELC